MFGVSRKKSKPTRIRSTAASSSEDEGGDDGDDGGALRRAQQHQRRKKKDKGDKKKKKKAGAASAPMLSFDPEEGGGDGDEYKEKKSKKRKKHSKKKSGGAGSMGYGGLGVMEMNISDGETPEGGEEKMDEDEDDDRGGSYYDAAALAKLKSQQKRTTLAKDGTMPPTQAKATSGGAAKDKKEENDEEEQFISLSGTSKHGSVLTGDEAIAFAQRDEDENNTEFDHGLMSPPTPPPTEDKSMEKKVEGIDINADRMNVDESTTEVEEGNRRWEDTMARRAGVLPPKSASSGGDKTSRSSRMQQRNHNQSSLGQIQASLQPTIANLENVFSDLETSISRHESTVSSARDELTTQQSKLETHGKALEYYQGLREDLATWMGALRELNTMVEKVESAKNKLESEMTWKRMNKFWEWGKDCTEVLEKQGLLQNKVMGEHCLDETSGNEQQAGQVDEFGRDLSSMASMSRVNRWNQRRKRCLNRLQDLSADTIEQRMECSNEDNVDKSDIEDWKQRHEALHKAIGIIPDLVKDEYLSISNLCTLFLDWERTYPDDYANCYANMSLLQMIEVLARLELCEKWNVLDLHAKSSSIMCNEVSELKWFDDLEKADSKQKAICEDNGAESRSEQGSLCVEVTQKQVAPRILGLFASGDSKSDEQHGAMYNPFSVIQTKQLCSMLKSILGYLPKSEGVSEKILNSLVSTLKYHVAKMAVPIVDPLKVELSQNQFVSTDGSTKVDDETADAIVYASVIQAKELCALVKNILEYWYTLFHEKSNNQQDEVNSLVKFVFEDLISARVLPLLNSTRGMTDGDDNSDTFAMMPKTIINEIFGSLQDAGLLGKDEWMLSAAPLRAALQQWTT